MVEHMECPRAFLGKLVPEHLFFFPLRTPLLPGQVHGMGHGGDLVGAALGPQPVCHWARLTNAYMHMAGEWASLLPAPRWAQLLHPGGPYWPTGLARLLANAANLVWSAMGEGIIAVAGPRPDVVGRALPAAVLTPHDWGVPNVILRMGKLPLRQGAALEMILVPGTTRRMLLKGHTLQPLSGSQLLPLPGRAPEGLLWALATLFQADGPGVVEPPPEERAGMPNHDMDPDLDLEVWADGTTSAV